MLSGACATRCNEGESDLVHEALVSGGVFRLVVDADQDSPRHVYVIQQLCTTDMSARRVAFTVHMVDERKRDRSAGR